MVALRAGDPPAPTLGFVAAVALADVVATLSQTSPLLKWPNDLLIDGAKLSGTLLERSGNAVVIGVGVNLAHHPNLADRRTTSLAAHGSTTPPSLFATLLADSFAAWLLRWRTEGFAVVRAAWLARAHPAGTPLQATLPDGELVTGLFEDLAEDGALVLHCHRPAAPGLAADERRVIHAGDVFLV